jgi:hypothetical protein
MSSETRRLYIRVLRFIFITIESTWRRGPIRWMTAGEFMWNIAELCFKMVLFFSVNIISQLQLSLVSPVHCVRLRNSDKRCGRLTLSGFACAPTHRRHMRYVDPWIHTYRNLCLKYFTWFRWIWGIFSSHSQTRRRTQFHWCNEYQRI